MAEADQTGHSTIQVLIVDDHTIVRKGTRALLAEVEDIEVVGEAADGREAVDLAETLRPDVILMDLVMPGMDGIEATRQITGSRPETRVLALTSFAADDKVFPAIKAGALGYLLKHADPEELVDAIRQVHHGKPSLHPTIARKVLQEMRRPIFHSSSTSIRSEPTKRLTEAQSGNTPTTLVRRLTSLLSLSSGLVE